MVDATTQDLHSGDILLLCSDGLYTEVDDAGIADVLRQAATLDDAAHALVDRANAAGGADNVTVVLARIGYGDQQRSSRPDTSGTTQEHPVVDAGTARAPVAAPAIGARVLEPAASGRRRVSRTGLLVGAAVLVVLVMIGGAWWAISRSFTIESGPGDTVWVDQGVKLGPIDLTAHWQDTGVPVADVKSGQFAQQLGSVGGEGATVQTAVNMVWADGLGAPIPTITAAPAAAAHPNSGG